MKKQFRSFKEARKFVYSLGIKKKYDWDKFAKSNKKPDSIPTNPNRSYKKQWISWGDWLGTGRVATHLRKYKTFQEARNYVHDLRLKNQKSWFTFSKSNKKPNDIPNNPNQVYKYKGWTSWGDWLGTRSIGPGLKKYETFEKAKKFAYSLGLTGANEWRIFVKSGKLQKDIPANPNQVYKNKGWISWGDWTGTNVIATYNVKFKEFEEAKKFARSLNLKTANEWRNSAKSGNVPEDIPHAPNFTYKNKGWRSWGDWLGTGYVATTKREYIPWKEAKPLYQKISKENKITTRHQWEKYVKKHKLPDGLPPDPWQVYTQENILRKMMK